MTSRVLARMPATRRHAESRRLPVRTPLTAALIASLGAVASVALPGRASAQISSPCEAACAATLVGTSAVVATGVSAWWGHLSGGISTEREAYTVWGTSFALFAGSAVALAGDGHRQRRAVYASAAGAAAGSLVGLAIGTALDPDPGDSGAWRVASALVGAAAGAWAGGLVGALTHDTGAADPPLLQMTLPF